MERRQRQFYQLEGTIPQATPDPISRRYEGVRLTNVTDGKTARGLPYKTIEFLNPDGVQERLNIWDKKVFDTLQVGVAFDLTARMSEKGFWNAKTIVPSEVQPEPPIFKGTESPTEAAPTMPLERAVTPAEERERVLRSMNAMPAAATVFAALIQKDIIVPTTYEQSMELFAQMHQDFIAMHEPPKPKK